MKHLTEYISESLNEGLLDTIKDAIKNFFSDDDNTSSVYDSDSPDYDENAKEEYIKDVITNDNIFSVTAVPDNDVEKYTSEFDNFKKFTTTDYYKEHKKELKWFIEILYTKDIKEATLLYTPVLRKENDNTYTEIVFADIKPIYVEKYPEETVNAFVNLLKKNNKDKSEYILLNGNNEIHRDTIKAFVKAGFKECKDKINENKYILQL